MLKIEIWSDIACPWCYIGKRRLERALARFEHPVQIQWRSFELDPSAPKRYEQPMTQLLAKKYGMSVAQAQQAQAHVTATAAQEGLSFKLDQAISGNTFDAHRLIHFARTQGKAHEMKERLMRAYFEQGLSPSDHDTLVTLAQEVGLDQDQARAALEQNQFADEVRQDQARAAQIGVRGVPFFVFDGRLGVSGAQPPEALLEVLNEALKTSPQIKIASQGPVCDDTSCDLPETPSQEV